MPYQMLADAVLAVHFSLVIFVVGGLACIVVGNLRNWRWVNNKWFRLAHVLAIGIVVAQAWLGTACPLTTFESWLRAKAGAAPYDTSFIEYWVARALFYDAPLWVFTLAYTAFGALVLASWWYFPPRIGTRRHDGHV
jgi:polyferredoxin